MKKLILVPTDFSEVCDNAIRYGVEMCKNLDHNLCLLHIIDKTTRSWMKKDNISKEDIDAKLQKIARNIEEKDKFIVQTLSREGNIFETIGDVAEEIDAELMLLGTHGKVGWQKLTGSYALRVITDSPVPVIVVQEKKFKKSFDHIVFPIDDTYATRQKVSWAVYIAKKYNAKIHVFQSNETSSDLKHKLKVISNQIAKVFTENKVKYDFRVAEKEGQFASQVNQFAQKIEADLIMIMTNGNESMPVFILGPWDERILFNPAGIPVMCINPHDYDYVVIGS
ncbi:MAG: universal stress protein [Bacteroidales bacterium]|nr:universal stress protein [Bacteroidales bacterium]MCF8387647.1 universal stress protein [Bacteroidales bacterium]MCF8399655.1 universal stress protein [Bacteroidales bacterium]